MNSTVTRGTPRTNSMKITENSLTVGILDRRPSAKKDTEGERHGDADRDTTMVTSTPAPQSSINHRQTDSLETMQ